MEECFAKTRHALGCLPGLEERERRRERRKEKEGDKEKEREMVRSTLIKNWPYSGPKGGSEGVLSLLCVLAFGAT